MPFSSDAKPTDAMRSFGDKVSVEPVLPRVYDPHGDALGRTLYEAVNDPDFEDEIDFGDDDYEDDGYDDYDDDYDDYDYDDDYEDCADEEDDYDY